MIEWSEEIIKPYRLGELSRKLNISVGAIVNILKKNNVKIDQNLNSKISVENVKIVFKESEKLKNEKTKEKIVKKHSNAVEEKNDTNYCREENIYKSCDCGVKIFGNIDLEAFNKKAKSRSESEGLEKLKNRSWNKNEDKNKSKAFGDNCPKKDINENISGQNSVDDGTKKCGNKDEKFERGKFLRDNEQSPIKSFKQTKEDLKRYRIEKIKRLEAKKRKNAAENERGHRNISVFGSISVNDFANLINVDVNKVIEECSELGMKVTRTQNLERKILSFLADLFGFNIRFEDKKFEDTFLNENKSEKKTRSPIVTIMGHVDHGKTSLLDYIRKTNVTKEEAGGITQHIGAYKIKTKDGSDIIFLDTPGHEAFTAMRARGCDVTDIVILIVAADDGVQEQTIEALNQAKNAEVPIVFAINKIDKEGANPEKVENELSGLGFLVEEWGGDYQCEFISAKTGKGVDSLLEKVLFEAEMIELKANFKGNACGVVLESSVIKGRGFANNVIVKNGELKVGDIVVIGNDFGKIKAIYDDRGNSIKKAYPVDPVQIFGINTPAKSGERFFVVENESKAKEIVNEWNRIFKEQQMRMSVLRKKSDEKIEKTENVKKSVNIIIKADVNGSAQAIVDSLLKFGNENIDIKIVSCGVGPILESDVEMASVTNSFIIGFNIKYSGSCKKLADTKNVDIKIYSVIYAILDDVKKKVDLIEKGKTIEKYVGKAEIKQLFDISKVGKIAGCVVVEGPVFCNNNIKVVRNGEVIFTGVIKSMKHQKDDVKSVKTNGECGICIKKFESFKVGDFIEFYEIENRV